jgi:hypothetical protein
MTLGHHFLVTTMSENWMSRYVPDELADVDQPGRHLRARSVISFSAKLYFLTGSAAKTQCRSIRPLT